MREWKKKVSKWTLHIYYSSERCRCKKGGKWEEYSGRNWMDNERDEGGGNVSNNDCIRLID